MLLVSEILATITVMKQGVGIRNGHGTVKPMSIRLAHKHTCTCVAAANPQMNVLENRSPFLG
jgi:hypothetical protein